MGWAALAGGLAALMAWLWARQVKKTYEKALRASQAVNKGLNAELARKSKYIRELEESLVENADAAELADILDGMFGDDSDDTLPN